ncbi:MAG: Hsp70 family protein, partial [Candidatus Omnitrophica bacterium]|nr:Hsp70 family protein [Candidatus Omnitrophota bacterium]
PRGVPQIEVTFDIDTDGIVHVNAKDKGTGKEQSIRITAPTKLSDEEIEKMVKEAEKYAEDDKKQKETVEMTNQANALVYSTEKSVKDYGDKISDGDKANIEKELNNLKEAIKSGDADKIKQGTESLQKVSHKLAEEVYKATAAQQAAGQPGPEAGGAQQANADEQGQGQPGGSQTATDTQQEDIIDADFKAEDDSK